MLFITCEKYQGTYGTIFVHCMTRLICVFSEDGDILSKFNSLHITVFLVLFQQKHLHSNAFKYKEGLQK